MSTDLIFSGFLDCQVKKLSVNLEIDKNSFPRKIYI